MPPSMFGPTAKPLCGRGISSFAEREEIALLRCSGLLHAGGGSLAGSGEWHPQPPESCGATPPPKAAASRIVRRQRNGTPSALLAAQSRRSLRRNVRQNLCRGTVGRRRCSSSSGAPVPGLKSWPWESRVGTDHGRTGDGRANAWSPEQIARRLPVDFADDATMRISHEAIYQALFVQGRGALRRELTACLRTACVLRMPRARTRGRGKAFTLPRS